MTTEKLIALLREVAPDRNHTLQCERIGADPECVRCQIDAALEQKPAVTELTDHQREWIVRIARAAVMWGSRAGSLYTIGRDSPNPESFTAMELANRAFAEIGIEGRFTMPAPTPPRKARGAK